MSRIFFGHPGAAAAIKIVRRGGIRWLREPDPEILKEKKQELAAIIRPKMLPTDSQGPQAPLLTAVQDATARMTRSQQTRTDRLLQQTGISLDELLILIQ